MQRRLAILAFLAVLAAGGLAWAQHREDGTEDAQPPPTLSTTDTTGTTTGTSTVLGRTATSSVPIPPKPTGTTPRLPRKNQNPPPVRPPHVGDLGQTDAEARQQLEAFLSTRPELVPYEEEIWYSAHYSYSNITAKGLAGLLWCVGFRVAACDREQDALDRQR